jgi:regulatory protein
LTRQQLENAALRYLGRFSSSTENLRRVLMRRLARAGHRPDEPEYRMAARWIDEIVLRMCASTILDDGKYAEAQAASLSRRGVAARGIRARLAAKGVAGEAIEAALDELRGAEGDADLKAAALLARRRRLGPYRAGAERKERRAKDMAALARQGFSYQTACRVIDAADAETLERLAHEREAAEFPE